jgi:predicted fused transcriptional regulator/phosphomethylpyrimidine kinase
MREEVNMMNTHPDIRVALATAYLAELLERARQEELRRTVASTRSERRERERRRLTRRSRVPQEAA